jgi:predicted DNA-binding transcriptional regulator AlpA
LDIPPNSRQLSFKELKSLKGVRYSRMTVWRGMRDGWFPQSHRTPTGRVFWWEHEIDAHKASLEPGGGKPPPEKKVAHG